MLPALFTVKIIFFVRIQWRPNTPGRILLALVIMMRVLVKIQNRGPEQEIPAVTCVRLIAQKHRY